MFVPRSELKFRITEATATAVRNFARANIEPDPYADPVTHSYLIDSLYFDSDDMTTFWRTVNGARQRYKLRVRTYGERESSPVFFEVKRCIDGKIVKERGAVRRSAVENILSGWLPAPEDMLSNDPEQFLAVENFVRLMRQIDAKPKAFVRYFREAWIGRDDREVRLTMDREIGVSPRSINEFPTEPADAKRPFGKTVVLEFKFFGSMPAWFPDLAHMANLQLSPAAKYCEGVIMHSGNEFGAVRWPTMDPSQLFADQPEPATIAAETAKRGAPLSFLEELRVRSVSSSALEAPPAVDDPAEEARDQAA